MDAPALHIFEVDRLIEDSRPRARGHWLLIAGGVFVLLVLGGTLAETASVEMRQAYELLSAALSFAIFGGMIARTIVIVRAQRAEQARLEGIEELLQLRRWSAAAQMVDQLLSTPTRTLGRRVQGLLYLTTLLARYGDFEQAVRVSDHLLEEIQLDPRTEYAVKLGRAMAILREDRLLDADRAIGELKRIRGEGDSAGLSLIELYRDVKTGHPQEAVEIYEQNRAMMTRQLGHRVADAHALAAKAYDLLGRSDEAAAAYRAGTLLSPAVEIVRRYPELSDLSTKYAAAAWPGEVA